MLQVASDEANPQAQPCGTAEHGSQFPDVKDVFNGVREAVNHRVMRRTCTPDVAQSLSPCLTSTITVESAGPSTCSPSSALAVIAPDQPFQSGWKVVDLCAQCASQDLQAAHVHGSSESCCSTLKCAFIRGYDEIDRVLRILGPFTAELEGDQSPNANHILMLCGTAEGAATSLLWQLSGIIRQIVPFSEAEKSKGAFTNPRTPPGTHKPSIISALNALGRMISLFAEYVTEDDNTTHASCSSSSSSSRSSSSPPPPSASSSSSSFGSLSSSLSLSSSASSSFPTTPPASVLESTAMTVTPTDNSLNTVFFPGKWPQILTFMERRAQALRFGVYSLLLERDHDAVIVGTLSLVSIAYAAFKCMAAESEFAIRHICAQRFGIPAVGVMSLSKTAPTTQACTGSVVSKYMPIFLRGVCELILSGYEYNTVQHELATSLMFADHGRYLSKSSVLSVPGGDDEHENADEFFPSLSASATSSSSSSSSSFLLQHEASSDSAVMEAGTESRKKESKAKTNKKKKKKKKKSEASDNQVENREKQTERGIASESRGAQEEDREEKCTEEKREAAIEVGREQRREDSMSTNRRRAEGDDDHEEEGNKEGRDQQQGENGKVLVGGEQAKDEQKQGEEPKQECGVERGEMKVKSRAEKFAQVESKRRGSAELVRDTEHSSTSHIHMNSTHRVQSSSSSASSYSAQSRSSPSLSSSSSSHLVRSSSCSNTQARAVPAVDEPVTNHVDEEEGWVVQKKGKGKQKGCSSLRVVTQESVKEKEGNARIERQKVSNIGRVVDCRTTRTQRATHGLTERAARSIQQSTPLPHSAQPPITHSHQPCSRPSMHPPSFSYSRSSPHPSPPFTLFHPPSLTLPERCSSSTFSSPSSTSSSSFYVGSASACLRNTSSDTSSHDATYGHGTQREKQRETCKDEQREGRGEERREGQSFPSTHTHGETDSLAGNTSASNTNNNKSGVNDGGVSSSTNSEGISGLLQDICCVVCQDAQRAICFFPCGHMVCCERCAQDELMRACPMCRADITAKAKVFF